MRRAAVPHSTKFTFYVTSTVRYILRVGNGSSSLQYTLMPEYNNPKATNTNVNELLRASYSSSILYIDGVYAQCSWRAGCIVTIRSDSRLLSSAVHGTLVVQEATRGDLLV